MKKITGIFVKIARIVPLRAIYTTRRDKAYISILIRRFFETKTNTSKLLALLLAGLMLTGSLVACGNSDENTDSGTEQTSDSAAESETTDPAQDALNAIGKVDYEGADFGILYAGGFKNEIEAEEEKSDGSSTNAIVISEAVHERNTTLEESCNLTLQYITRDDLNTAVRNESVAPTGDFVLIDASLGTTATNFAVGGYLSDWKSLDIDLEGEWWDQGTADFVLNDAVYFMSGSHNFSDDNLTYALIFNKDMQKTYENTVPNPYNTVREKKWTLDYFNTVIQGISKEDGSGKWDELDTYGFAVTWEFGNTFFIGCDLRYVINDDTVDEPTLYPSEKSHMEKALNVLDTACSIFHDNNATFRIPGGKEAQGLAAFKESRALFYSEVVSYLTTLNAEMEGAYGVLPVPKYDEDQEFYRTWTHDSGSTFSITSSVPEARRELVGDVIETYTLLSHQIVKPEYYDTVLTSRNLRDGDSAEMMDIIFANRVYDMGFYFQQLNFYSCFKECVNDNSDAFASKYKRPGSPEFFERNLKKVMANMNKDD